MILDFKEIKKEDVLTVGGKGANLGEMVSIGCPVPAGFVITADTYQDRNRYGKSLGLGGEHQRKNQKRQFFYAGRTRNQGKICGTREKCQSGSTFFGNGGRFAGSQLCWTAGNVFECDGHRGGADAN